MADLFNPNNDPFSVIGQDTSAQRTQVAQYSILRAAAYLQKNDNSSALKEFKKALAFDSQNLTAQTYIGKLNLAMGNNYEAIKAFKTMVSWQPSSQEAHINLANAYLQDKQYANSENEFKSAARLDSSNPLPDYSLGLLYTRTDRLGEAESQFLKVKKIAPRDGNVFYALGALYNKQGRYEDAVTNLEKAVSLKKNFSAANFELGVAYDALGRTDDANAQLAILQKANASQAGDLKSIITKPGMVSMNTERSGGFIDILGSGTPLYMFDDPDPAKWTLHQPDGGRTFSVTIKFSSEMDIASVTNPLNWSVTKAKSTEGGYYNNLMPENPKDAVIPTIPLAVVYNTHTQEATVQFRINQNATGDALIDPKHIVFKFSGKDAAGKDMDQTANEIDGYSVTPF